MTATMLLDLPGNIIISSWVDGTYNGSCSPSLAWGGSQQSGLTAHLHYFDLSVKVQRYMKRCRGARF